MDSTINFIYLGEKMEKIFTKVSGREDVLKICNWLKENTTVGIAPSFFTKPENRAELAISFDRGAITYTINSEYHKYNGYAEVNHYQFYEKIQEKFPKEIKIFTEITPEELENIYPSLKEIDQTIFGKDCPAFKEIAFLSHKSTDQFKTGWDRKGAYNWYKSEGFKLVSLNKFIETITGKPMKESNPKSKVGYPCPDVNKLGTWDYQGKGYKIGWTGKTFDANGIHHVQYITNWTPGSGWTPIEVGEFTAEAGKHFGRDKAYKHQKRTPWDPEL